MGNNIVVMVCQSQKTQNQESAGKPNHYHGYQTRPLSLV